MADSRGKHLPRVRQRNLSYITPARKVGTRSIEIDGIESYGAVARTPSGLAAAAWRRGL